MLLTWHSWLNWCGSRLLAWWMMWWMTWIQRAGADDVARLINFASNVFCASILFAEFPSWCCWRRGVTADLLILLLRRRQGWKTSCGGYGWCCCWRVRFSGGCGRWFVTLFWVTEDNSAVAALQDRGDSNSVWLCGLLVAQSGGGGGGWVFDLPMAGRGWNW
jgi:hypothetical protein